VGSAFALVAVRLAACPSSGQTGLIQRIDVPR
jgi:hypothetical protein